MENTCELMPIMFNKTTDRNERTVVFTLLFQTSRLSKMNNSSTESNDTIPRDTMVVLPEGAIIAYNAYLSGTIAFGVPGNLLVLVIYLKSRPVTSTDWFIIFISIYDLISSLISVPIYLTFSIGAWIYYGNDVICKLHMFISQSAVLSSTFLICGLAIERFYKVCRPKSTTFTSEKSKHTCMAISVTATVLSLPCFALFYDKQMHCGSVTEGVLVKVLMAYYTGMLLSFLSAVVILIFTYSRIAVTILKSQLNLLQHKKDHSDNQPKRKHRLGTFLAMCCQEKKIYPYNSDNLQRTELNTDRRSCAVGEVSEDNTIYLNRIGSTHVTDDNENETEMQGDSVELNKDTRECNRDNEADVIVSYITLRSQRDEFASDYLELQEKRRPSKLPRIRIIQLEESETNPNHSVTETCLDHYTECPDLHTACPDHPTEYPDYPARYPDHRTEPTRQTRQSTTENNQILKTVKSMNEIRRLRRSLKTTRIVFLICLIFILSWIPPWVSFINFVFMSPSTKRSATYLVVNMFFRMTYLINTFSNPILYTAFNKKFREKVRKFICRR